MLKVPAGVNLALWRGATAGLGQQAGGLIGDGSSGFDDLSAVSDNFLDQWAEKGIMGAT